MGRTGEGAKHPVTCRSRLLVVHARGVRGAVFRHTTYNGNLLRPLICSRPGKCYGRSSSPQKTAHTAGAVATLL